MMREVAFSDSLASLLAEYAAMGGLLDFVALESTEQRDAEGLHRAAAVKGMAVIDQRLEAYALANASHDQPLEKFFRLKWDASVARGELISFEEFWGRDAVGYEPINANASAGHTPNGFKSAFFDPPYHLHGPAERRIQVFEEVVERLFESGATNSEIYSWSTNWSNYFDAGHEWWGAFYWTLHAANSNRFVVIAGSSTD
jgi:hypothetical protein